MIQKIITADKNYGQVEEYFRKAGSKRIFLVCDSSIQYQVKWNQFLKELMKSGIKVVPFSDFQPNPLYESVVKGVELFNREDCDSIIGVGGGSAIDVAKCIKLYSNMDGRRNFLEQDIVPTSIPFLAMPTTAGTGSEATKYAVIYYKGIKQSITHNSCIPEIVLLDADALKTLPVYQRKSTMLDAFCHAIESFWSVNSTEESRKYSREAIGLILANKDDYLANLEKGNGSMLLAAHIAGKAINITQTTAGHAMCYKLTSLYGVAHGHAAALCDRVLFSWMVKNTDRCIDKRGKEYLRTVFEQIAESMGCGNAEKAADKLRQIFMELDLSVPKATEEEFRILKNTVNLERLKNHPIRLDADIIDKLYHEILSY